MRPFLAVLLLVLGALGCEESTEPTAPAIQFRIDSPTCSHFDYRFSIDQVVVGDERLSHGETSNRYPTSPGQHELRAAIVGSQFAHDTTAMVGAGDTFVHVVPVYCS